MKKLLSILIAIALMLSLAVPAFAMQIFIEITVATGSEYITLEVDETDRIEDVKAKIFEKNGTPISLQVLTHAGKTLEDGNTLQDYSIQQGSTIHLSAMDSTIVTYSVIPTYTVTIPATVALGETATIKAENVVVVKGKQVEVTLTNANGFTVATPQGAELGYTVKNGETIVNEGDTVLAVNPDGGKTGETTLTFDIDETKIQYAGTYTGSATFTIAVKDAPKAIINFTIDGTSYQAEEGMTWAQWVVSPYNNDGKHVLTEYGWIGHVDSTLEVSGGLEESADDVITDGYQAWCVG